MSAEPDPVFKSRKRQRVYRNAHNGDDRGPDQAEVDTADGIFARAGHPTKKVGTTFTTQTSGRTERQDDENNALVAASAPPAPIPTTTASMSRFVAPTGQILSEDNKHISAFIDVKLAEARLHSASPAQDELDQAALATAAPHDAALTAKKQGRTDLSASTDVDVPRPQRPPRPEKRPRKVRLGRDGKPYVPRKRNVRSEDDVARDKLVEQILAQNRPAQTLQDKVTATTSTDGPDALDSRGRNAALDAEVAEAFERDFRAAVELREARAKEVLERKAAEQTAKGPKMGGTKNRPNVAKK